MDPGNKLRVNSDSTKQWITVQPLKVTIKFYMFFIGKKKW